MPCGSVLEWTTPNHPVVVVRYVRLREKNIPYGTVFVGERLTYNMTHNSILKRNMLNVSIVIMTFLIVVAILLTADRGFEISEIMYVGRY